MHPYRVLKAKPRPLGRGFGATLLRSRSPEAIWQQSFDKYWMRIMDKIAINYPIH